MKARRKYEISSRFYFPTLIFILLNAAIWFVYAGLVAFGMVGSFTAASIVKWVMVILALCTAAALVVSVVFLRRRRRLAFYAAEALLALIAVLSITDEFGLPDLTSLLLTWFRSDCCSKTAPGISRQAACFLNKVVFSG